jgi:peptide/nickel transport system substrate-binding protein
VNKIGVIGNYTPEDLPLFIQRKVSLGLTTIAEDGKVKPGLAKSWSVGGEGKVWEFEIGGDYIWHDGKELVAEDIKYKFKGVEVRAEGDKKIIYEISDSYSPFSTVVAKPAFREGLVGVGPYKLKSSVRSGGLLRSITLTPAEKHSLLPNLVYQFYRTEDAALLGFKLGEVDEVREVIDYEGFGSWKNVEVESEEDKGAYVGLLFDVSNPKLENKFVRQALAYAIEDKSFGYTRVTSSISEESWAYNNLVKQYEYDLEKAIDLLENNGGEGSEEFKLNLSTTASLLGVAEEIARDWNEIGVDSEVQVVSAIPEEFEVLLVIQKIPLDPDQYAIWHSTQASNVIGYQNPRIDRLLELGRKELDKEERKEIYLDFQRYLLEDCPAVFLYRPERYAIRR